MKVLAYILTAAAVLIGADVFVTSSGDATQPAYTTASNAEPISLHGGSGMPPPPPDAY